MSRTKRIVCMTVGIILAVPFCLALQAFQTDGMPAAILLMVLFGVPAFCLLGMGIFTPDKYSRH